MKRFWISPGALLGVIGCFCAIILIAVFVAVPFYTDRADRQQQAQQDRATRIEQRQQAQQFVHKFDCTFGVSLKAVLLQLEIDQDQAASRALTSLRLARAQHDTRREGVARKAREDALRASGTYSALRAAIPVLDGKGPCP